MYTIVKAYQTVHLKWVIVLCQLYLNEVEFFFLKNYTFPFYHRHSVWEEHARGGELKWEFTNIVWNLA